MSKLSEWLASDCALGTSVRDFLDKDEIVCGEMIAAGATPEELGRHWRRLNCGVPVCAKDGYPNLARCRWAVKAVRKAEIATEETERKAYWEKKKKDEALEIHLDRLSLSNVSKSGMKTSAAKRRAHVETILAL